MKKITYIDLVRVINSTRYIANKKKLILSFIGLTFLTLDGCKKLVEIDTPITQIATTNVFSNDNTAIAAQLSVYIQMKGLPANMELAMGLSADELNSTTTDGTYRPIYLNALTFLNGGVGQWTTAYAIIYQENAIIENVQTSDKLSIKVKNLLIGEAQFMRAYWYFYLVNLYGDVPLVTTTDYTKNSAMARTPKDQVYQQIVTDLLSAKSLLSTQYLDGADANVVVDRIRPTTWAADALLARVYLYTNKYADAITQSSLVISNTSMFSLPNDINAVFKANSNEAIWQIAPQPNNPTSEATNFILITSPVTAISSSSTISPQLLNAFESNDKRKANWVGMITVSGNTYYFPYKYKLLTTSGEYSMILRLAEQYLIRAEAEAQNNDLASAINDLNIIRNRAGISPLVTTLTKDQVLAAVAQERRVELFTEGQRWLDLKRTGTLDAVMGTPSNANLAKGGAGWQPYQAFYPIPQADITNNPNLKQTPGY